MHRRAYREVPHTKVSAKWWPVRTRSREVTSIAQVISLTVTLPETVDAQEIEDEIVTALADRLRDDHGYELVAGMSASVSGTGNEYPLRPSSSIVIEKEPRALRVKLRGVKVDARDLFTQVSSELEQRHQELRAEIG